MHFFVGKNSPMKISYTLKYDKKGFLYKYVEKTASGKIVNFYSFNYKRNLLTKYDFKQKLRVLVEFYEPCKLVHRFEAGESWIKPVPVSCESTSMFLPKIKRNIAINDENQIVTINVSKGLLRNWNSI
jgi:hypothetical protein